MQAIRCKDRINSGIKGTKSKVFYIFDAEIALRYGLFNQHFNHSAPSACYNCGVPGPCDERKTSLATTK